MLKKIKKIILISVVLFVVIEIFLRIFYSQKLIIRHYPDVYENVEGFGYKYKPNSRGIYSNAAFSFDMEINNLGWYDKEFTKINKNKFRIIFVGSSDMNGYVKFLKKKFLNSDIEVINCSIDGAYRELERLKIIKDLIIGYQPDVIFFSGDLPFSSNVVYRSYYKGFQISYSDLSRLEKLKVHIEKKHIEGSLVNILFKSSYMFRYLCKYYSENDNSITKSISFVPLLNDKNRITEQVERMVIVDKFKNKRTLSLRETTIELIEINEFLKNREINFVCSSLILDQDMYRLCDSIGIKYFSTNNKFDNKDTFGKADGHLTPEANQRLVEDYYKLLIDSDIIPSQFKTSL